MPDSAITGTDWRDSELDAIVADYFAMLVSDLSGQPYLKSRHRLALQAEIGRSDGSIEFKHQNISAVLDELGLPWIKGYKPAKNYQNAIFDAIDRYLTRHTETSQPAILQPRAPVLTPEVFVSPPMLTPPASRPPERLKQLIRKFDVRGGEKERQYRRFRAEPMMPIGQACWRGRGRNSTAASKSFLGKS